VQHFRGGLVFKALGLCASLNSRIASNNEEDEGEFEKQEESSQTHQLIHARPFVGVSPCRSWSHLVVLGAILWACIAKTNKISSQLTFEVPPRRA